VIPDAARTSPNAEQIPPESKLPAVAEIDTHRRQQHLRRIARCVPVHQGAVPGVILQPERPSFSGSSLTFPFGEDSCPRVPLQPVEADRAHRKSQASKIPSNGEEAYLSPPFLPSLRIVDKTLTAAPQ
jgi:hypothetical protein